MICTDKIKLLLSDKLKRNPCKLWYSKLRKWKISKQAQASFSNLQLSHNLGASQKNLNGTKTVFKWLLNHKARFNTLEQRNLTILKLTRVVSNINKPVIKAVHTQRSLDSKTGGWLSHRWGRHTERKTKSLLTNTTLNSVIITTNNGVSIRNTG